MPQRLRAMNPAYAGTLILFQNGNQGFIDQNMSIIVPDEDFHAMLRQDFVFWPPDNTLPAVAASANANLQALHTAGAGQVALTVSGNGPATLTSDIAANQIALHPNLQNGGTWRLRIINTNANTVTFAAGANCTIVGNATIATNRFADYVAKYTLGGGNNTVVFTFAGFGNAT